MGLHTLEICAGVGMLGEGLRAGLAHLGITHRTVAYLEREAYAASVLAARMEEGSLDAAPVWPDLLTFDGRAWRGAVDCIAAGFPCQDLSLAGRRAGLDGARSGLFFNILDIADDCDAQYLFLENVSGITSATASTVDEESASEYVGNYHAQGFSQVGAEDGRLLERAAARVLGELADRGWHAEWLTLSASDVGASHRRARWFCWAWRQLDNTGRMQRRAGHEQDRPGSSEAGGHQAHHRPADGSGHVAHPERPERRQERLAGIGSIQGHHAGRPEAHGGPGISDAVLGDTDYERTHRAGSGTEQDRSAEPSHPSGRMANPGRQRLGAHEPARVSGCGHPADDCFEGGAMAYANRNGQRAGGKCQSAPLDPAPRWSAMAHAPGIFAPGPSSPEWPGIIASHPHLAPALEPTFRMQVNGLDFDMGDCRAQRLKCVGNGVVALCAAAAVVKLLQRASQLTP